ncbi:MAG: NAD(P)/FAD-dependent oxidoreductase [Actinobacteria bacterium]|nr:NAD(P)/FAD-dependent oxidoreductase [Actinomycetota bacterium]
MVNEVDYLIIGGGLAGAKCALTLRNEGARGRIIIVSADRYPPYHRPPLSKGLLLKTQRREQVFVVSEDHYAKNEIELDLDNRVERLDADLKVVSSVGGEYRYGRALIATGADPRILKIDGSELKNIFYLRTLTDSDHIEEAMSTAKRAAIIGAGFIGMELASAFVQNGIDTTMIVRENQLWGKLGSADISEFFKAYYLKNNVKLLFNEEAARLEGEGGLIKKVVTKSGRQIPCDMLCIGVGVIPATGFIGGSGIEIKNGVVANENLQTGAPDLFAAGDVANFYDRVLETRWRVEHWDNALKQGELAAKNMLGHGISYNMVSYFFSDIFDFSYEFLGDNRDADSIIFRGSFDDLAVTAFYLKDNRLKAAFLLGRVPEERHKVESVIKSKKEAGRYRDKLADDSFDLSEMV